MFHWKVWLNKPYVGNINDLKGFMYNGTIRYLEKPMPHLVCCGCVIADVEEVASGIERIAKVEVVLIERHNGAYP